MVESTITATSRPSATGSAPVSSSISMTQESLVNGTSLDRFAGQPGPVAGMDFHGSTGLLEPVYGPTRGGGTGVIAVIALGYGPVTIDVVVGAIGVGYEGIVSTWSLIVDGVVVASDTATYHGGLAFWGHDAHFSLTDVPVHEGSLISLDFQVDPIPYFLAVDDFARGGPGETWLGVSGTLRQSYRSDLRGHVPVAGTPL
jgi:hypothetical protein